MKAIVVSNYGDPEVLISAERKLEPLKLGEVRVQVKAAGICHRDLLDRAGLFGSLKLPRVLGHEFSGIVTEISPELTNFNIGDRVASLQHMPCGKCVACLAGADVQCHNSLGRFGINVDGGYAEYVTTQASGIVKISPSTTYPQAAIACCTIGTAYHALHNRAQVQPTETVLVTGATGGVGIHAVQLARLHGCRVLATTSAPEKVAWLKEMGAAEVGLISPENPGFHRWVREVTKGEMVNVVIENTGEPTFDSSLRSLSQGGRIVVIGNLNGKDLPVQTGRLIVTELSVLGSVGASTKELKLVLELIAQGKITPVIAGELPFSRVQEGHRQLAKKEVRGRLVLVPDVAD